MTAALQQVHLRFNGEAGQPLACRVRVTGPDGYYAPLGRLTRFATERGIDVGANVSIDGHEWAIVDGTCEIALPPGPLKIEAKKGPEYRPLNVDVALLPGKMSLRFTIERWSNLAAEGWHSGDTCCYEMSPHAALLEAAAQDLSVVDLLIREGPAAGLLEPAEDIAPSLVNIAAYSGQRPALETNGRMVVVNTANRSPHGRLLLLNTHRTVYPLSFQAGEKWSLIDWCDQCHRKKGLVVADDWLPRLASGPVPELLDRDFLRHVDAIRFHTNTPLDAWWDALRRGDRLPLVAGSGKESNRELLGSWRTYARLPVGQPLDYAAWTEAVRAGRTFVTNGPLLSWTLGERFVAEAKCATKLGRLQLLKNGDVIAETRGVDDALRVESAADGDVVIRAEGPNGALAMSSPITAASRSPALPASGGG